MRRLPVAAAVAKCEFQKMNKSEQQRTIVAVGAGCLFTLFCWICAAALSLGPLMGDCIDSPGLHCPTQHQRNLDLLKILLGTVVVNVAGLLAIGYATSRSGSDRS